MANLGLFFDYDGVLSPLNVERSQAFPSRDRLEMLSRLRSRGVVVAVISSKDCPFLMSRSLDVDAVACVNGLEIRVPGYVVVDERVLDPSKQVEFSKLVEMIEGAVGREAYVERKRLSLGTLVGASVDWRSRGAEPSNLREVVNSVRRSGFPVKWSPGEPFVDIYMVEVEKDLALKFLRRVLDVRKVVYFGDSLRDVPAFNVSDVKVFVRHSSNKDIRIGQVDYIVDYEELPKWVMLHVDALLE